MFRLLFVSGNRGPLHSIYKIKSKLNTTVTMERDRAVRNKTLYSSFGNDTGKVVYKLMSSFSVPLSLSVSSLSMAAPGTV